MPLAIVTSEFAKVAKECIEAEEAIMFEVSDFDDRRYKAPKSLLERIFAKPLTSVVSYDALSIRDLWYATVS